MKLTSLHSPTFSFRLSLMTSIAFWRETCHASYITPVSSRRRQIWLHTLWRVLQWRWPNGGIDSKVGILAGTLASK
ncbi:hypothetical protein B0J13DRAFT_556195 [Dactylonectria estremocensis]|uniref:Uncharacterized protein n=1 Tax=Dactylonectria estremocensis TaxID=1079267 RepID=A0A9P9ERJ1_9HYPO|nr:hypothetical protein B0J13DRAFT_556195 [Dactylonectria estremocensis]